MTTPDKPVPEMTGQDMRALAMRLGEEALALQDGMSPTETAHYLAEKVQLLASVVCEAEARLGRERERCAQIALHHRCEEPGGARDATRIAADIRHGEPPSDDPRERVLRDAWAETFPPSIPWMTDPLDRTNYLLAEHDRLTDACALLTKTMLNRAATSLPCGHTLADLIGGTETGPDGNERPSMTKCGACLGVRQEEIVAARKAREALAAGCREILAAGALPPAWAAVLRRLCGEAFGEGWAREAEVPQEQSASMEEQCRILRDAIPIVPGQQMQRGELRADGLRPLPPPVAPPEGPHVCAVRRAAWLALDGDGRSRAWAALPLNVRRLGDESERIPCPPLDAGGCGAAAGEACSDARRT